MNRQEVEARVQAAIENLQAGRGVEDDAGIEFKSDWPDPIKKARQLAGAANSLRGDPLLLVIGVDDKSGSITTPSQQEPQEWYAKARKKFDQIAPELLRVQTVFVGDRDESVQALVFDSSEFPYVINEENRREVPIRVGAGTESARRNQLVRMFEPIRRAPWISVTEANVWARWQDTPTRVKDSDPLEIARVLSLEMRLRARVLVEHSGSEPTTLPVRDMRARLVCGDHEIRPDVSVIPLGAAAYPVITKFGDPGPPQPVPPQFGVYALDNHVIATAPGEFKIDTRFSYPERRAPASDMSDLHDLYVAARRIRLDLVVRVVGVEKTVRLSAELHRSESAGAASSEKHQGPHGETLTETLGYWQVAGPEVDPWADVDT